MTTDPTTPTAAELWAQIDPTTLTTDQLLLYELNHSVIDLRGDVRSERKGRRLSFVGISVAILVAVLVGGMFATQVERDRQQACATRVQSRQDIRALAVAMIDEVSKPPVDITADARTELLERARARAFDELPPPDC